MNCKWYNTKHVLWKLFSYYHFNSGIYDFVNLNGGGKFVRLMEKAMENKNYDEIDKAIRNDYADYLYDMYGLGEAKEINLRYFIHKYL